MPRGEAGSCDHAVDQLPGDAVEDLVVLRAVGLELRVPASDVLLHGFRVERNHVLDHPSRLGGGEAGARDDPLDESGIGRSHEGMVDPRRQFRKFLPDFGQIRPVRRRSVACSRCTTPTRRLFTPYDADPSLISRRDAAGRTRTSRGPGDRGS